MPRSHGENGDDAADPDPLIEARLIVALRDLVDDEHPSEALRHHVHADLEARTPSRPSMPLLPIVATLLITVLAVTAILSRGTTDGDVATGAEQSASFTTAPSDPAACRDSIDAACGAFRWDPMPTDQPATLQATLPPGPIIVAEQHTLSLVVRDPDGRADLRCYSVRADGPALTLGTCVQEDPGPCPERYGPWTPPKAEAHEDRTTTVISFQRVGTYVVSVDVPRVPGCDNLEPFRSGASARLVVDVVAPTGTT